VLGLFSLAGRVLSFAKPSEEEEREKKFVFNININLIFYHYHGDIKAAFTFVLGLFSLAGRVLSFAKPSEEEERVKKFVFSYYHAYKAVLLLLLDKTRAPRPSRHIVAGSGTLTADSLEPSGIEIICAAMRRTPVLSSLMTVANVPPFSKSKVIRTHSFGLMPFLGGAGSLSKESPSVVINSGSSVLQPGGFFGLAE
jgi:hypothetical protein